MAPRIIQIIQIPTKPLAYDSSCAGVTQTAQPIGKVIGLALVEDDHGGTSLQYILHDYEDNKPCLAPKDAIYDHF